MEYSDDYLQSVMPAEDPPSEAIPAAVTEELGRLEFYEEYGFPSGALVRRSTMWTYAVFEQRRLGNYVWEQSDSDSYQHLRDDFKDPSVQFGLFDPKFEEHGYGLIFPMAASKMYPAPFRIGRVWFPNLKRSFPVMARMMFTTLHAPARPANANSACWARDNAAPHWWGFITSGHAVSGVPLGGATPLAGGHTGALMASRHPPIDAAFVATVAPKRGKKTSPLTPFSTINFPAAGLPVEIVTSGGAQNRNAVAVTNSMGVINTSYYGIQVFLDNPCAQGDSGSLVRTPAGEAVALYSGAQSGSTYQGQTGQTLGLSQHFEQALFALGVSAWL
jgi:hypothetical protein